MIVFVHDQIDPRLTRRRLLCTAVEDFLRGSLPRRPLPSRAAWRVTLGENLLFDGAGLAAIGRALAAYTGPAARLEFALHLSPEALRDYYSHQPQRPDGRLLLPVTAERDGGGAGSAILDLTLPELTTPVRFPTALTPPDTNRTPLALLMPFTCEHDLLFANQIALIAHLAAKVKRAPGAWLRAALARRRGPFRQRLPLFWTQIDPTAQIHPTAVVEGSRIGAGCRVGAHCVVRYSVLGRDVCLHDGAKVEHSAVDDRSWLMHDLVLYRCVVESDVFLIHGPYQFSCFQHGSAAFATIMMDYRPDGRAIAIATDAGSRAYRGRFLGALLAEGAKVFGGTLTAPGLTVPRDRAVYSGAAVVRNPDLHPPAEQPDR